MQNISRPGGCLHVSSQGKGKLLCTVMCVPTCNSRAIGVERPSRNITMGRSSAVAAAIFMAVILQNTLGFYIAGPATSTRSLQQPHRPASTRPQRRPQLGQQPQRKQGHLPGKARSLYANALKPSRWSTRPLAAQADGGGDGGGEGFSAAPDKVSRRSAKKSKARGGPPVIPEAKKVSEPQQVSKAVVADVLGAQAKKDGGGTPDETAAARKAIENMEKKERERIEERQARIDNVMAAKTATEEDPNAGSIPEIVSNRMLKRMVPFFVLPAIGGVGVFVAVYVLSHNYDYTIPAYIVAYATQAPFFVALAGITYAIMSASWDEEREGTFFGFEEAKRNVGNIVDGLRRSSDRLDVEDMLADEERQKLNRSQRRQRRKQENDANSGS